LVEVGGGVQEVGGGQWRSVEVGRKSVEMSRISV
jgi:hypothetical protein